MTYKLPNLPYSYDALEPHISEEIMKLHHDKHHRVYVDKLNEALKDYPKYQKYSVDVLVSNWKKLPKAIQEAVRNQGGGDSNHTLFWTLMKPDGGSPTGDIAKQINEDFGTFEKFKKKFNESGTKRFGSGWVWLVYINDKLQIISLPNQDSPLTNGDIPIIGLDVWEHAFYTQYKNEKDKYLDAWWNVVNWDTVNTQLHKAKLIADRKPTKNAIKKQYGI